jgi:hypothetical protein
MLANQVRFSVDKWAERFGNELWDLAQRMTKSNEIKAVRGD